MHETKEPIDLLLSTRILNFNCLEVGKKQSAIPITVRQLEAVIRMSESIAKMELVPFASDKHVDEALRLFRVSTIEAAATGNLAGQLPTCSWR